MKLKLQSLSFLGAPSNTLSELEKCVQINIFFIKCGENYFKAIVNIAISFYSDFSSVILLFKLTGVEVATDILYS